MIFKDFPKSNKSRRLIMCNNQMQLWIGLKTVAEMKFKLSRYRWKKAVLSFPHPEQVLTCKCKECRYFRLVKRG